jgi:hypothetical protein
MVQVTISAVKLQHCFLHPVQTCLFLVESVASLESALAWGKCQEIRRQRFPESRRSTEAGDLDVIITFYERFLLWSSMKVAFNLSLSLTPSPSLLSLILRHRGAISLRPPFFPASRKATLSYSVLSSVSKLFPPITRFLSFPRHFTAICDPPSLALFERPSLPNVGRPMHGHFWGSPPDMMPSSCWIL